MKYRLCNSRYETWEWDKQEKSFQKATRFHAYDLYRAGELRATESGFVLP